MSGIPSVGSCLGRALVAAHLLLAAQMALAQQAVAPEAPPATPVVELTAGQAAIAPRCHPDLAQRGPFVSPNAIVRNLRLQEGKSARLPFATGESLAEVIKLPPYSKPYHVEFWLSFDVNFKKANEVVVPSVVLVDGDFCEIADLGEPQFKSEASFFTGSRQTKGRFPVDDDKPKYALVYTDARRVGEPAKVSINHIPFDFVRAGQGYMMVRLNK